MNGVEIAALSVLVSSMVWYLKYQTKRQAIREDKQDKERKEEISFIRNLVTNDMKDLHKDSVKNAELNKESLVLQKQSLVSQKDIIESQAGLVKLIESVDKRINGQNK